MVLLTFPMYFNVVLFCLQAEISSLRQQMEQKADQSTPGPNTSRKGSGTADCSSSSFTGCFLRATKGTVNTNLQSKSTYKHLTFFC